MKDIKTFLKKKKTIVKKTPTKDIQTLLKKKKKIGGSVIKNVSRNYLSIEEIVI